MLCSKPTDLLGRNGGTLQNHRIVLFVILFMALKVNCVKNRPYNKCYVRLQQYQAKAIWHSPTVICDFKPRK